jgi:hypothetical protein
MKRIAIILLLFACNVSAETAGKLVYSRQPRATTPFDIMMEGKKKHFDDGANWQPICNDLGSMTQCTEYDFVIHDLATGVIKDIHNCTGSALVTCAAGEPAVSYDGTKILYSVLFGSALEDRSPFPAVFNVDKGCELWEYTVATGAKKRLTTGYCDRFPFYKPDGKIAFSSNRSGTHAMASMYFPPKENRVPDQYYPEASQQYWEMKGDGSNKVNVTPHEQYAVRGSMTSSGNIDYSSFQGSWPRTNLGTPNNHWWLLRVNQHWGNTLAKLGATHNSVSAAYLDRSAIGAFVDPAWPYQDLTELRALGPCVEIYPGKIACSNYYRGNSLGPFGVGIVCDETAREGAAEKGYLPSSCYIATPFGTDEDGNNPIFYKAQYNPHGIAAGPVSTGRAGFFEPWPSNDKDPKATDNDDFLFTWMRGWGYVAAWLRDVTKVQMGGEETAHKVIARAKVKVVTNPFDQDQVEVLVGDPRYHQWGAKVVAPYEAFFGMPTPAVQPAPASDGKARLVVKDIHKTDLPGLSEVAKAITQLRVEYIELHTSEPMLPEYKSVTVQDCPAAEDGSVTCVVQCEKPFRLSGLDKDGHTVMPDLMLHSLRCGEQRECKGCHAGHAELPPGC